MRPVADAPCSLCAAPSEQAPHPMTISLHPHGADIFASRAASLVNPVNCIGVSGKGLALAFKRYAPDAVACYERMARKGMFQIGDVFPCLTLAPVERGERTRAPLIYFFPTKQHWRNPSRVEWIEAGLEKLTARVVANAQTQDSVAIPALGCGLGGLRWAGEVEPLVMRAAERMSAAGVRVEIYEP